MHTICVRYSDNLRLLWLGLNADKSCAERPKPFREVVDFYHRVYYVGKQRGGVRRLLEVYRGRDRLLAGFNATEATDIGMNENLTGGDGHKPPKGDGEDEDGFGGDKDDSVDAAREVNEVSEMDDFAS